MGHSHEMGASKNAKGTPMKIEIEYEELLDIVNALKARADVLERMPAPLEPAQRDHWKREAENHRALADRLLAQADAGLRRRPSSKRRCSSSKLTHSLRRRSPRGCQPPASDCRGVLQITA